MEKSEAGWEGGRELEVEEVEEEGKMAEKERWRNTQREMRGSLSVQARRKAGGGRPGEQRTPGA